MEIYLKNLPAVSFLQKNQNEPPLRKQIVIIHKLLSNDKFIKLSEELLLKLWGDDMEQWIEQELVSCQIGDKRLDNRYLEMLDKMNSSLGKSLPATFENTSELIAAHRFFKQ